MGYTHYWTQHRSFTADEWMQLSADLQSLLKDVQHVQGIPLSNGNAEPGTSPEFRADDIAFNGLGEDSHETFVILRQRPRTRDWQTAAQRGWDFCKTARKPYDLAVTAALCYLTTTFEPPAFTASSDGDGSDWIAGLEEARRAIPRVANVLDIPRGILEADRWCMPWVNCTAKGYTVNFCVDGYGYVQRPATGESYRFGSHLALAQFLDRTKQATFRERCVVQFGTYRDDCGTVEANIWNATGSFDGKRQARIAKAQSNALARLFPVPAENAYQPPAFVRPGEMPTPERSAYYFSELLNVV